MSLDYSFFLEKIKENAEKCTKCGETWSKLINGLCVDCKEVEQRRDKRIKFLKNTLSLKEQKMRFSNFEVSEECNSGFKFAKTFLDKNDGLLLYGTQGIGKTHLMIASYIQCYLRGNLTKHINFVDLKMQLDSGYKNNLEHVAEPLIETKYLYLDDLGAQSTSYNDNNRMREFLYYLLEKRDKIDHRNTFITTNYSIKELKAILTDRLVSRILGTCNAIEMKGKDRRI